ncbi:hypothetical protein NLJ89_g5716 [Agrocybe chaxingu]|uniref:Uncharacterized protein n=1 Tax=Agrocybe chaxingu TaxID=84603 RepID=A0A9W8K0Q5_9AGAR|nr:hypothetical protein NLJ89_g5716 [Agrocybe chaxingu]
MLSKITPKMMGLKTSFNNANAAHDDEERHEEEEERHANDESRRTQRRAETQRIGQPTRSWVSFSIWSVVVGYLVAADMPLSGTSLVSLTFESALMSWEAEWRCESYDDKEKSTPSVCSRAHDNVSREHEDMGGEPQIFNNGHTNYGIDPRLNDSRQDEASVPFGNIPPRSRRPSRTFARQHENTPSFYSHSNREMEFYYYKIASHQDLLAAGNKVYGGLYDAYNKLAASHEQLKKHHEELRADMKAALQQSSNATSTAAPQSAPPPPSLPKPRQEDYPNVKFFTRRKYNAFIKEKKAAEAVVDPDRGLSRRGGARLAQTGENVTTDYVEYEDGTIVSGKTAEGLRQHIRAVFRQLLKDKKENKLPKVWSEVSVMDRRYILHEVYAEYPYVSFCEDHWKADYLVSRVLSQWHNTLRRAKARKAKKAKNHLPTPSDRDSDDDDDFLLDTPSDIEEGNNDCNDEDRPARGKRKQASEPSPRQRQPAKRPRTTDRPLSSPPASSPPPPASSPPPTSSPLPPPSPRSPAALSYAASPAGTPSSPASSPNPSCVSSPTPSRSPLSIRPRPRAKGKQKAPESHEPSESNHDERSNTEREASLTSGSGSAHQIAALEPTISFVNPLNAIFGPAAGPSSRLDGLRPKKATPTSSAAVGTRTTSTELTETAVHAKQTTKKKSGSRMKTVNASNSPKHVFLHNANEPITPAAFEAMWKQLGKEEKKASYHCYNVTA